MKYQKNEQIEVNDGKGNWLPGRYVFESCDEGFHVIECFELFYCYLKTPDDKIRKVKIEKEN